MMRFISCVALLVAGTASAQDPLTNAKRVANKAASAENAHIEAEQRPDGQPAAQPQPQPRSTHDAKPAARKSQAPVPILLGRHLLKLGMTPGPEMGAILNHAFDAQLEGSFATVAEALVWLGTHCEKENAPLAARARAANPEAL